MRKESLLDIHNNQKIKQREQRKQIRAERESRRGTDEGRTFKTIILSSVEFSFFICSSRQSFSVQ